MELLREGAAGGRALGLWDAVGEMEKIQSRDTTIGGVRRPWVQIPFPHWLAMRNVTKRMSLDFSSGFLLCQWA